jgi:hypothetical protein
LYSAGTPSRVSRSHGGALECIIVQVDFGSRPAPKRPPVHLALRPHPRRRSERLASEGGRSILRLPCRCRGRTGQACWVPPPEGGQPEEA